MRRAMVFLSVVVLVVLALAVLAGPPAPPRRRVRPDRRLSEDGGWYPAGPRRDLEPGPVGKGVRSRSGLESRDAPLRSALASA